MKLFVIGGTGRTGKEFIHQALERGHAVTAFVRSPGKIKEKNDRLTVIEGNVFDEQELAKAMQGHDAVSSMLGPLNAREPSTLMQESARSTVRAMQAAGVKRITVLSAAAHFPGILNGIARFVLRNHMRDSIQMEHVIRDSGLEWTIARPPRLTNGGLKTYRSCEGALPRRGFSLSRSAVAAFMLDAIEQRRHLGKIVGLAK